MGVGVEGGIRRHDLNFHACPCIYSDSLWTNSGAWGLDFWVQSLGWNVSNVHLHVIGTYIDKKIYGSYAPATSHASMRDALFKQTTLRHMHTMRIVTWPQGATAHTGIRYLTSRDTVHQQAMLMYCRCRGVVWWGVPFPYINKRCWCTAYVAATWCKTRYATPGSLVYHLKRRRSWPLRII